MLFSLLPVEEEGLKFPEDLCCVKLIVEVANEVLALFVGDLAMQAFVHGFIDFRDVFVGHFGLDVHLEQVMDSGLQLCLHKPKLFIYFVPEDFTKDSDVVVFVGVVLNA